MWINSWCTATSYIDPCTAILDNQLQLARGAVMVANTRGARQPIPQWWGNPGNSGLLLEYTLNLPTSPRSLSVLFKHTLYILQKTAGINAYFQLTLRLSTCINTGTKITCVIFWQHVTLTIMVTIRCQKCCCNRHTDLKKIIQETTCQNVLNTHTTRAKWV